MRRLFLALALLLLASPAWATISVTDLGSAVGNGGSSVTFTIPSGGVPAGACVVVVVMENADTLGTVADNVNSGNYTSEFSSLYLNNNSIAYGSLGLFFYNSSAALASGKTITYTKGTNSGQASIAAFYVTGQSTSSLIDTSVTNSAYGSSASPSVTSGTPSVANELFVAGLGSNGISYTQDTTHGWATPPDQQTNNGGEVAGGSQLNSGTGTKAFAPTAANSPWAVFVVGIKPAVAATIYNRALLGVGQ